MTQYSEAYLKIYYDKFKFFDPQCTDKRVREVMMISKRCLACPGIEQCKLYAEYWLKGETERGKMNEKLVKGGI